MLSRRHDEQTKQRVKREERIVEGTEWDARSRSRDGEEGVGVRFGWRQKGDQRKVKESGEAGVEGSDR